MQKLFIFDLDGVLVDACDWHRDALNEALQDTTGHTISMEEHISIFNGIPTKEKLKILTSQGKIAASLHQRINTLKQKKTIAIIKKNANIRQEKINMLKKLKEQNHIVCCYTNSIRETASLMLQKTGIYNLFKIVLTNEDVVKTKPDPEGYNYLINYFNINKEMCYIIEDSPKGLMAAKSSGANVIKVSSPDEVDFNLIKEYT